MAIIFEKKRFLEHKGRENLSRNKLNGTHPMYIFYAKQNDDELEVLYFDWFISGTTRKFSDIYIKDRVRRFNIPKTLEELTKKVKKETTHIITGYYDLINDEWHETQSIEVSNLNVSSIEAALLENIKICGEIFYNSKELFLENLIGAHANAYVFTGLNDLDRKIKMEDIINILINWLGENKGNLEGYTTEDGDIIAPLQLIVDFLNEKNIPELDEHGRSNFWNLTSSLRGKEVFEFGILNTISKEIFKEESFYKIDRDDIENNPQNYKQIPLFSEHFLHIFG